MAAVAVTAPPFVIQKPSVKVGATGSEVTLDCAGTNLDVAVNQDESTVETFCGAYTSYKAEQWTVTFTVAMSYGDLGVWNALRPLVGTVQPFTIAPAAGVPGPGNPTMTGTAVVRAFDFISAGPGEASEIDVVLGVQGIPTWGVALAADAEGLDVTDSPETPVEAA